MLNEHWDTSLLCGNGTGQRIVTQVYRRGKCGQRGKLFSDHFYLSNPFAAWDFKKRLMAIWIVGLMQ